METARQTNRIVWQNIAFAFAVKLVVLALGGGRRGHAVGSGIRRCGRDDFNRSQFDPYYSARTKGKPNLSRYLTVT